MAEVTRAYSNFHLPLLNTFEDTAKPEVVTLVDQSSGLSSLRPAVDVEPASGPWRSTLPFLEDAVALYEAGYSLTAIEKKLGIAWDSVARLLDRAGVRERKNKGR
ncbi:MAG: hypothetical protein DLM58_24320, partial [Pseudonocardiales bacterium]